jgi:hypothetical protein
MKKRSKKKVKDSPAFDMDNMTTFTKRVAERFRLASTRAITMRELSMVANNAELIPRIDHTIDTLFLSLRSWILAGKHAEQWCEISYPETWWEHVKHDLAPAWFLRRWPVKYKIERVRTHGETHVCPHADVKWPDNQHLEFIFWDQMAHEAKLTGGPC